MRYKILRKQNNDEHCFVCGVKNDAGIRAEFYECVREGSPVLITKFATKDVHQSYPGRTHGGVISALLDESIGRAVTCTHPEVWAVTIELTVKFRKPVPTNTPLFIEAFITKFESRTFEGEGKMMDAKGVVLATAVGKFFRLALETAIPGGDLGNFNRQVIVEKLPEFIEIGD